MPTNKLKDYLDNKNIKYVSIYHSPAHTAQEIAASAHIPGKELVKTVMVKIDGKMAMAVLPAPKKVSLETLKSTGNAQQVELATEQEFKDLFPQCELGAMPPFGNLYDMQVYADTSLSDDKNIAFNACSHTELLKLSYEDFVALVKPVIGNIAAN